jgi:non-ribosomal peptide synthetase component E (peptide arylation enzyme)
MKTNQPALAERFTAEEIAAFRAGGFWGDECLSDFVDRNAIEQPEALFNADGRGTLTFGELKRSSDAMAQGLNRLGVGRGDQVTVQLPNWIEASITYCAIARLGAVYVPRMMVYRDAEMQDAVDRTESKALVVADQFRGFDHLEMALGLRDRCPSLEEVVVVGTARDGAIPFQELVQGPAYEGPRPLADDVHIILFTSGTTAKPKGVVHTFNTYVACAHILVDQYRVTRADVCFMPSPVMHNTGNQTGLLLPLFAGCPSVYQDVFEPKAALAMITEYGCTYSVGATPFVTALMDAFDPAQHDLSRFRLFACGGAPVPGIVVERAVQILGCKLMTVFGQGESHVQTATRIEDPVEVVASSDGCVVKGMQVSIRDDEGDQLPPGVEGEICSRGPGVMLGYWQDPEQTAAAFDVSGWFHSGDLGRMNEAGYLRVTGRKKDIIIRGGMNISALEVEELLLQHPSVKDVAVVGMPDARLGEKVCVYVVPAPGARPTLEELTGFMKSRRVMMQKLPERLELRDSLPRTPTGKVEKFRLRDEIGRLLVEL